MELPILDNFALRDAVETSRLGARDSAPDDGEGSFAQHLASSPSESSTTAATPHAPRAESRDDDQRPPQDADHDSSDVSVSAGPPPPQDARHDSELPASAETDSGETDVDLDAATTDSPTTTPETTGAAVSATPLPAGEKTATQQTAAVDASTAAPGPASVTGSTTPTTPQARQTETKSAPTPNASSTDTADIHSPSPAEITAVVASVTPQTAGQGTADRETNGHAEALAIASPATAEEPKGPTPGKSLPRTDRAKNAEKHAAGPSSEAKSGDDSADVHVAAQQSQPLDAAADAWADIDLTAPQTDDSPSPDSKAASTPADAPSRTATPAERLPDHLLARAAHRPAANADATHVDQTRLLQRVARAIEAAPQHGGTIRLRLSPPELGSLQVEVTVQKGALSARLEAETQAARAVLLDNLPQLRDRLAEQGLRIDQFEVNVSQRDAGDGRNPSRDYRSEHQSPVPHPTARVSPETASDSDTATRIRRFLHPGNLNVVI